MAWELCEKKTVAALHPISTDELEDEWSEMVEGLIRQHLGQPYLGTTSTITGEYYSGDGSNILRVRKPPISSVTSLLVNTVALTASDYVVFDSYIQLKYLTFPKGTLNVQLSYTSGSTSVDETVQLCAAAMIVALINYRKRLGADSSLKWGTLNTEVGEDTGNKNFGLVDHLVAIMQRLLRRPILRIK